MDVFNFDEDDDDDDWFCFLFLPVRGFVAFAAFPLPVPLFEFNATDVGDVDVGIKDLRISFNISLDLVGTLNEGIATQSIEAFEANNGGDTFEEDLEPNCAENQELNHKTDCIALSCGIQKSSTIPDETLEALSSSIVIDSDSKSFFLYFE